jgi:glycosyltransferase involved in cell wall biosynthesis
LICDLNIQKKGHYIGYNQYILSNIHTLEAQFPGNSYSFLYNEEAKQHLDFSSINQSRIHFVNENCWSCKTLSDRKRLVKTATDKATALQCDHLIFMDLDQYQLPIFLTRFSSKLSGVLFRPHHRIQNSNTSFSSKISTSLQRYKKILAEKFLTYTKNVENIFILNDKDGVAKLNAFHGTTKFKYLPDPIFAYPSVRKQLLKSEAFKFLIFGAINERKNITAIIKAYDQTSFPCATELHIVGSSDQAYLSYLQDLLKSLPSIDDRKKVVINSSFVTNEEMDNYFSDTDVCLLIYKDFFGSSGLLGRAALHKKKVIGANVGLLNELISQNKLGITCDPASVTEISKALLRILELHPEPEVFDDFYKSYSPELFLKTLLS